jgi:hypothetical protein
MSTNGTLIERNLLFHVLNLTKRGSARKEQISLQAGTPQQITEKHLEKLSQTGLIELQDKIVKASPSQRIRIAFQAIRLGVDSERVCRGLEWIEFENLAAVAFEANQYEVKKRFRFKWAGRRLEIDILGYKESLIVCADCKQWLHGWTRSSIAKAVELQVKRTRILAEALPSIPKKIILPRWKKATLIPAIVSLVPGPFKFYTRVPIVPVLQLQNFLEEIPAHTTQLVHFTAKPQKPRSP